MNCLRGKKAQNLYSVRANCNIFAVTVLLALIGASVGLPLLPVAENYLNGTVGATNAIHGVDVSSDVYESTFSCLKNSNYGLLIVRAWHSYGAFDSNAVHTLYNALNAGLTDTNVYLFPVRFFCIL